MKLWESYSAPGRESLTVGCENPLLVLSKYPLKSHFSKIDFPGFGCAGSLVLRGGLLWWQQRGCSPGVARGTFPNQGLSLCPRAGRQLFATEPPGKTGS